MKPLISELEVWLFKKDLLYTNNLLKLIGLKRFEDMKYIQESDIKNIKLDEK